MDDNAAVAAMTDPELNRMRARRNETQKLILEIHAAISRRAEARTKSSHSLPHTYGRHSTSWTRHHEQTYQDWRGAFLSEHRRELGALDAKLVRQNRAITQRHLRDAARRTKP
jgi:hypothetical protein|tara:strand:- start:414 stop:752 length:339 start_codon:yes stop_codon:yes gene_type:complete